MMTERTDRRDPLTGAFLASVTLALLFVIAACGEADDDDEHMGELQPTATPTSIADREHADVPAPVPASDDDAMTEVAEQVDIPEYVIEGGNREIYVTDLTGERQQRLTDSPAMNASPVWSPDGEQIAWVQIDDAGDQDAGLYVANADGSEPQLVTSPASPRGLDWHPDGDRIAFVSSHETDSGWDEVHIVNLDGSERRQVTFWEEIPTEHRYYGSTDPAWSPDGEQLAVIVDQLDAFEQIHLLNPANDEPAVQLTDIPDQRKGSPTWAPDGSRIAFHATPHEHPYPQIFVSDISTGETSQLTEGSEVAYTEPDWSPDGTQIALIVAEEETGPQIQMLSPDDGDRYPITSDPGGNYSPVWSPDGLRILFVAERDSQLAEPCSMHASVTLAPQKSLEELAWSSYRVIVGTVVEEHNPAWAEPRNIPMDTCLGIYTDYTVEVETQLRGEQAETVRVRLPGGVIGEYEQSYEPSLEISEGERVLLFLSRDADRELLPDAYMTGPQRGWAIVDDHLDSGDRPTEFDGMPLTDAEGIIRDALAGDPPAPEPHGFVPLDESPVTD